MIVSKKILIVDDEADLTEILQFNLESEGYEVDCATSAEEALKILTPEHSLILLDVMMSGISGYKLAEILRKEKNNSIPIIFLTAKDGENDMLTGFSVGGDDYIIKPFSIKEVSARVKAVLARSAVLELSTDYDTNDGDRFQIGGILIDLKSKNVSVDGVPITLTKTEFEILLILSQKPSQIFSRDDMMEKVWGSNVFVATRTIDVHIARLRKKLGDKGRLITNRSGYGYCIEIK